MSLDLTMVSPHEGFTIRFIGSSFNFVASRANHTGCYNINHEWWFINGPVRGHFLKKIPLENFLNDRLCHMILFDPPQSGGGLISGCPEAELLFLIPSRSQGTWHQRGCWKWDRLDRLFWNLNWFFAGVRERFSDHILYFMISQRYFTSTFKFCSANSSMFRECPKL